GFSLQANAKTIEGRQHPDRDGQFRYINAQARAFGGAGDPVISVDAKKKEQVGQYANAGRTWRPAGDPVRVRDHGFPDPGEGKVRSEEHTSELQSRGHLVCRLLLEKKHYEL